MAFTDGLFGRDEPECGSRRRWLLRYLGVSALLCIIIVARRPDAVVTPQFWAEDGYVFFYENLTLGPFRALLKTYQAFPYLTHRLIAMAGGLVPLEFAPRVYTTSAIALTALALATFALPGFRHLVRSDGLRVLFGVAVVSAPFDQEVLSTVTNLGWFLAIWLFMLSFVRLPREPRGVALVALGGAVLVCSTPLAVINLPIWLLRAWHGVRRGIRRELVWSLVLVAALVILALVTRGLGAENASGVRGSGVTLSALSARLLSRSLTMMSYWAVGLVVPPDVKASIAAAGVPAVAGVTVLLLLTLLGLAAVARFRSLPALVAAVYGFVAFFLVFLLGRPRVMLLGPFVEALPYRYLIFPWAMLVFALISALDGLPGRGRRVTTAGVAVLLVWAWHSRFVVPPFRNFHWPLWAARLERKLATGSRMPLIIPANPHWAPLRFDPLPSPKDIGVPPEAILAGLGTHGTFSQGFVCRCAPLTGVEMKLAAQAPSAQGALRMTLLDARGRVVAQAERLRADLGLSGSWEGLVFDPIEGSDGERYTLHLQAVDNIREATIYVVGARGDPYPEGLATWGRAVIDGDASLRYGCAPPAGTYKGRSSAPTDPRAAERGLVQPGRSHSRRIPRPRMSAALSKRSVQACVWRTRTPRGDARTVGR